MIVSMKKQFFLFVAVGLLATGLPLNAIAAEDADSSRIRSFTGQEVVVTAGRVEELKKDVTSSITVIGRDQIENSPARDLAELLAEKGSGYIHMYPGSLAKVGIRGFSTDAHGNDLKGTVLVLLNGRRAGTGNAAKIMTENVERIEIIRGPAAVQYGSAAIGGVINIITKQGTGTPSMFAELKKGSYELSQFSTGTSGKVGHLDFSGSLSLSERGDYKTAEGDTYFNTGFRDKTAASFNIGYEFLPGHRIGVMYNHFEVDHQGSPYYLAQNDPASYNMLENHAVDFIYDGVVDDGKFSWMGRYYSGEDVYNRPLDPYNRAVDQDGSQGQFTYNDGPITFTAGFDWLAYEETSSSAPRLSEYENTAGFALLKARLFDEHLVLSGGIRYDDYSVNIKGGKVLPEVPMMRQKASVLLII